MKHLDGVSVPTLDREYLDFDPYDHQAEAEDIIREESSFFAINASPTGSGKTLSWLKPVIEQRLDTIAVYPTNALIADQVEAAHQLRDRHYPDLDLGIVEATGDEIAKWRDESGISKGKALRRYVGHSFDQDDLTLVFTNPDILTIIRKDMYRHRLVKSRFDRFEMVVLDEFHLADVKQRDSLLFLIDEMNELEEQYSETSRFYFLSATPEGDDSHGRSLYTRIQEDVRADPVSLSAEAQPTTTMPRRNWNPVMPPVDLTLKESQTFKTADVLLEEDSLIDFVEFCSHKQTVVMLDGVHEVDRVYEELTDRVDQVVERITGFNRGEIGEKLESFDVLVSNSAVEVGLDFQPERLVFSAHNASTLIQRLGRLREREDCDRFEAWCYVPGPVRARIDASLPKSSPTNRINRSDFEAAVRKSFHDECDLSSFSRRWGELEAYQHVIEQKNDAPSELQADVMEEGLARIERHYYEPYGREFVEDDLERLHSWTDYDVIDELKPYRGNGLQVMVRDHAGESRMKLYDMFYLLRWGDVEFKSKEQFRDDLKHKQERFYSAYSRYAVGFCEYFGKIPTDREGDEYPGRTVSLHAESPSLWAMKNESDTQRNPEVVSGITARVEADNAPPARNVDYLRDEMSDEERLCYVVPGHPSTVEATYGLDEFFFLYPLGEDSIALGTNALYMHCLVQDRIESKERDWGW